MRTPPTISEEQIQTCLQEQYDLTPTTFEFLPVGLDFNAGVYRVASEQGAAYLLKVTTRPLYRPRFLVPRYLNDQGITAVVAPLPTRNGALWASIEGWNVSVYPFIEGDTSWTGMNYEQWKEVGSIFQKIHQVALPAEGFESLLKETFDPSEYISWIRDFEAHHLHTPDSGSESVRAVRADWLAHQSTIQTAVASLDELGRMLQQRSLPFVIAHADLHPANLLRDGHGQVFVIDWDEVMLAPKERDFIFVREPNAEAFFQGYGEREIDWMVLAYYLWERIVQDLIVDAKDVYFRKDWTEENRAEAAQWLHTRLTEESDIEAAFAATARLKEDLRWKIS
ncbi:MAG TPA: phosphotransferase [Ktedonobacteraceae bacterium]|nr:phosphotransferase [Ktedonobacteraceae bacterium]